MEEDLLTECSLIEDLFQPLLIASETSTPVKALETLIETSRTMAGREVLANKDALPSALQICRSLSYVSSSHLLSLTLKLVRNLCAGELINQDLFLSCDGVGIILSTLDAMMISVSELAIIRTAIQVLANVAQAGEMHQIAIWSRFFPIKFHELARLRKRETCDPLCMVLYTCCNGNEGLLDELFGDKGLPLMDDIIRTATRIGNGEDWLKLLLSKICFETNYFPELFSRFFTGNVENGRDANSGGVVFGKEQAFLLGIISNIPLHEIYVPIEFASSILQILKQAVEDVDLLPEEKSGVLVGTRVDVIAYSLTILRDICANTNESTNAVVDSLLSFGLIELLLSVLADLEPPEMIRKAMEQSEDKERTSSVLLKPCPYKGFRRDVVSVIANCAFQRKSVQDKVRERKGIPLLLQHCVTDGDNPFLREWGIWAMRNLLEGNVENQRVVAELELQGSVDVPEITDLGMKVEVDPITRRARLVNMS